MTKQNDDMGGGEAIGLFLLFLIALAIAGAVSEHLATIAGVVK